MFVVMVRIISSRVGVINCVLKSLGADAKMSFADVFVDLFVDGVASALVVRIIAMSLFSFLLLIIWRSLVFPQGMVFQMVLLLILILILVSKGLEWYLLVVLLSREFVAGGLGGSNGKIDP